MRPRAHTLILAFTDRFVNSLSVTIFTVHFIDRKADIVNTFLSLNSQHGALLRLFNFAQQRTSLVLSRLRFSHLAAIMSVGSSGA